MLFLVAAIAGFVTWFACLSPHLRTHAENRRIVPVHEASRVPRSPQ